MIRIFGIAAWIICLSGLPLLTPATSAQESPSVNGDPNLLLMIRDAQHANKDRYPFGEIQVVAETGENGGPAPHRRIEALVRWDKDQQRINGAFADPSEDKAGGKKKLLAQTFKLVYRDHRSVMYVPEQRLMTISDVGKWGHLPLTQLLPQDWWYGKLNGEGQSWAERCDLMLRLPPEVLRHIRVRRLSEDRVEVSRDAGAHGSFRQVSSLRDDGNVILDQSADLVNGVEEKRAYVWSRDARSRCYLKSCRIERHFHKRQDRGEGTVYWTYEVTRFNPDMHPPQAIFEEGAIKIAPGTIVDDRIAGRRRRVGDRPIEDMGELLDRLIPELKSRGFAAPPHE